MPRISQREAQRLRKRVKELEAAFTIQRRYFSDGWFKSHYLGSEGEVTMRTQSAIRAANVCGHAVVARTRDNDSSIVEFFALPHYRETV